MGKTRAKKFGAMKKPGPTGLMSEKQLNNLELEAEMNGDGNHVPAAITNILEKIKSPGNEERACGCQMMASIVSHPKAIGFLMEEKAVRIVAPLFLDPDFEVRRSALGALRNISVYGEEAACDTLVDSDVFTPLVTVIKQYGDCWTREKESGKCQNASDIMIEAVELLSNLCEHNSKAVMLFNKSDLVTVLLPWMKVEVYGFPLAQSVAHCLHIVSENNIQVSKIFQQPGVLSNLYTIISSEFPTMDGVLYRTLVTGILLNLSEVDFSQFYNDIIKKTGNVIDTDIMPILLTSLDDVGHSANKDQYDNEPSWPEVDKFISAQRIGLELLANLCCTEDEWEEMEDDESEESCDDQAAGAASDECGMELDPKGDLCLPSEIYSAFTEHGILSKIIKKACPTEPELIAKLGASECGKSCLRKLEDLQIRALLCLSNTVSALNLASFTQMMPLPMLWGQLYRFAKQSQDCKNEDYMWAISSAMRAVLQKMAEANAAEAATEIDLDFIVKLGSGTNNTETQINIVRIISTIGCVLSILAQPQTTLKTIGVILLEVCKNNMDVVVVAEALDSIFDVFKEDETDWAARDIGLVQELKSLQPIFKSKVTEEKKKLGVGEKRGVVLMAKTNLSAFIKYKTSHK